MAYFVYVLISIHDSGYYIGITTNILNRLYYHNNGFVDSTRCRRPLELIYTETCQTKREALLREKFLKRQKGGNVFKRIINCRRSDI